MDPKDMFDYDSETGKLFWKKERPRGHFRTDRGWRVFNSRFAGKEAGTPHNMGYVSVIVSGRPTLAHRIIWEIHYGPIPDGFLIDHRNRVRNDNRIENLRLATPAMNLWNTNRIRGYNGIPGVSFDKRRKKKPFYARISMNGKTTQLGRFKTAEEAYEAWKRAATVLKGEWCEHLTT